MVWAWWTAGALLLLAWLVLSSNIRILFTFTRQDENDELTLDLHALFGMVRFRYTIPILEMHKLLERLDMKSERVDKSDAELVKDKKQGITVAQIKTAFENAKLLLEHCFQFNVWLLDTLKRVRCTSFVWKTSVGIGDAAQTACVVGMLWGLKSSMLAFLFRKIRLEAQPRLQIMPAFNELHFTMELMFKLEIRLGFLLYAGCLLLLRIARIKGGIRTWQRVLFKT
ncbi:DUF2953 domain-containing protein [Paenibacillus filicis]|uniref:DUF2953 domain-containing protein n=1 Tax=Paenibacillus gyeongsangnamensis TaxID=3388067 RepID=A0ABT4Q7W7_9BACL|nr:DUF2953 domain-containing protein [Paenibacillus filicis]MCZ8512887.1 DUF2953 domain-containing protein [Paenibacillus filicis]